jgi:hypothetical protein
MERAVVHAPARSEPAGEAATAMGSRCAVGAALLGAPTAPHSAQWPPVNLYLDGRWLRR